jgi:hypothetical protein
MSRLTAKMEPFIHRDNVPCHLLTIFEKGLKSPTNWEQLITEAVLCVEVKNTTDKECNATKEEEDHDTTREDRDFEESSTIMPGRNSPRHSPQDSQVHYAVLVCSHNLHPG